MTTATYKMRRPPEPKLVPYPSQEKRIAKAIDEIANGATGEIAKLQTLARLGDAIDELWEEICQNADRMALAAAASRGY